MNTYMIKENFLKIVHQWKVLLKDRAYRLSFLAGLLVLSFGMYINQIASIYKDSSTFPAVGDVILDKLPTYDLAFLYSWGIFVVVALTLIYPVVKMQERIPFMMKTFGLLLMMRAVFISLTQIGPPEGFLTDYQSYESLVSFQNFMFKNDLFFSGHTALPFMTFLLLKGTRFRWFMFGSSILMGLTVLLMHVHYSIDVFAAFFITHGIYSFSDTIFNKLNLRFKRRINLHGWEAFKKRVNTLRERRVIRGFLVKKSKVKIFTKKY